MNTPNPFTFEISLSVLDHLGRNLYRSFATVLGEAISNAWDADATNVYIHVDKDRGSFFIKDDGIGMTAKDFQEKFLKIGYSKRRNGQRMSADKKRPFIGRKGIGKLALLSCAERISVISKVDGGDYIGGVIDNHGLNEAITEDLTPKQYPLGEYDAGVFSEYTKSHKHGTIIYFDGIKDGIKSSLNYLTKIVALYFRFSLLDYSFRIFINGRQIDHRSLDDLAGKTQFLWEINEQKDPYVEALRKRFTKKDNEARQLNTSGDFKGFIASVDKPRSLKVVGTEERVGVDLFVNGRLRERDILKRIPTARVAENYLYGQVHFNGLDDQTDRFTSSREGIVADDPKYQAFLDELKRQIIQPIMEDWDAWRRKHRQDGDPENESIPKKDRKSEELYNVVANDYVTPQSTTFNKVDEWVEALQPDATFNLGSYAECFIAENLLRKFIEEKSIPLSIEAQEQAKKFKKREEESKNLGNVSIDIRRRNDDVMYLDMDYLANLIDKQDPYRFASLSRDAREYKPVRDSMAHTSLLTKEAKQKLSSVYENIKGRLLKLLSQNDGK